MATESALNVSSQKSVRVQCVTDDNKLHSCEDLLTGYPQNGRKFLVTTATVILHSLHVYQR